MSNQYNVDDILNEIKTKKARQNKVSARPSYRPEPRPARRPVAENIEDLSFEPSPAKPAESAKPKEENVLSFHSDVKSVSEAAPTREPETPVQTIPVSERPVQEHPAEERTPEPVSRSASFSSFLRLASSSGSVSMMSVYCSISAAGSSDSPSCSAIRCICSRR